MELSSRAVKLEYPSDMDPMWAKLPEFACAANSVSLLMPHVEPYGPIRAACAR